MTTQKNLFYKDKEYNAPTKWILRDKPAEKTILQGTESLSNAETLSAIIGANSDTSLILAKKLMTIYKNSFKSLASATVSELLSIEGVTRIIAARIKCIFEIGNRKQMEQPSNIIFRTSGEIATVFKSLMEDEPVEHFYVMLLNSSKRLILLQELSKGGLDSTVVDPRQILKLAIENNAISIVLSHNHPSGNLKPSRADEEITKKIKLAASFMGIQLLDHIIVSREGFFSFSDEGLI